MMFITNRSKLITLCVALVMTLCITAGCAAFAEGETTLTVQVKGLMYDMAGSWRAVTLQAPVDVYAADGSYIGSVTAGAPDSADTLLLNGAGELTLKAGEGAIIDGFEFAGDSPASVTAGQANLGTLLAYAKQGLFAVQNMLESTNEPLAGAEYAVLNGAGEVLSSFVMDETGAYRSDKMLPSGDYRLVQMRAAVGTMTVPPTAFTISTYFGNESDISAVVIKSQPEPTLDPSVGRLRMTALSFTANESGDRLTGSVTVKGVCDAGNNLPLSNVALHITADPLVDADGNAVAGGETSLYEIALSEGAEAVATALDASGAELVSGLSLKDGLTVALPEGTRAVSVSYIYDGQPILPENYDAGEVTVGISCSPDAQAKPVAALASADCKISYRYQNIDGAGYTDVGYMVAPASVRVYAPDGRERPSITVKASGKNLSITALPSEALSDDTAVIIELPHSARANEYDVDCDQYLRMRDNDAVVVTWARLVEGYTLPVRFGDVDGVTVYALDPQGLDVTELNPHGATLLAVSYQKNALWDTLLNKSGGIYAMLACDYKGAIHLDNIDEYSFVAVSGSLKSLGGGVPPAGVVLRDKQSNLCYGNLAEDNGSFVVYVPQPNQHTRNQLLDFCCMLPEGASETVTGVQGLYTTEITMPTMGLHITYSRRSSLSGAVIDESGAGIAGIKICLSMDGSTVAEQATDALGEYRFDALEEGVYGLSALAEGLLSFTSGEGFAVSEDGHTATASALELLGEQELKLDITAKRSCELRGSATLDGSPVSGLDINLIGSDGASLYQTTDQSGVYAFVGLDEGDWTLAVTPPDSLILSSVGSQTLLLRERVELPLSLEVGASQTQDIVFERTASIYGGSAALGAGRQAVAAYVGGSVNASTDAGGSFRIDNLTPGDYSVYVAMPDGKTLAAGSEWRLTTQGDMCWVTVSVKSGEQLALPELAYATYTGVEGYAYLDSNGDGARGADEPLLTGVSVALERATNDGWTDVASMKTDEYGKYCFDQLSIGDYRVASKTDAAGLYVATVGSGEDAGAEQLKYSAKISLRDGERSTDDANIGLRQSSALAFSAFVDGNLNGQRDSGERGVSGVLVELLSGDTVAYQGTTDDSGALSLVSVHPGDYALRVTPPRGYAFGKRGADSVVGGTSEPTDTSDVISFISGQTINSGVGLSTVGSFSGKVFEDVNDNGIMDEDEPGVAGVTLRLRGSRSGTVYELVTDESGLYVFNSLPNDSYTFTAELPEGMLLARYSKSGGDLRSVFTGETTERQYTVNNEQHVANKNVGVIERGSVEGVAFLDLNYNGLYDEGEPGFSGVALELYRVSTAESMGRVTTGDDGAYSFDSLRSGDYRLRAILPTGGSIFTKVVEGDNANMFAYRDGRRENSVQPIAVGSGEVTHTLVGAAVGATIEGIMFQDEDYNGSMNGREKTFSGMHIRLIDESGAEVATTTTGAGGVYSLSGIMPGTYTVEFMRKAGYGFTRIRPNEKNGNSVIELRGEYGVTAPIAVQMGDAITNVNAGMLPSSTVSGVMFDDLNDNGLREPDEGGMTSATVRLVSGDGEIDLTREVSASGDYFFDGVMPGSYTLTFILPEHAELAKVADGGNTLKNQGRETVTREFDVTMGESYTYPLVGAVTLGSFEGFVFHDINANGIADEGEERIPAVELTLTPSGDGLSEQSVSTGADGSYSIKGLRPSEYRLEISLPSGYILSHDLSDEGIAFEAATRQTVECPWSTLINRTVKPIGAVKPASVSGQIWLDENKNAARDSGEALLSGVSVELVSQLTGMVVKRVASDEQGFRFDAVRPGQYRLRFATPEQSEPAGEAGASFTANGLYMICDGISVVEAQTVENLSVGLVSRTSIGGKVRLDESGASVPVAGMTISLYISGQSDALQTAVTAEDGSYRFDGLWPGEYRLEAAKPQGMVFVRRDDANYQSGASTIINSDGETGASDALDLQMAQHQLSRDIVLIKPAKVGDQAWLDANKNGLIDVEETLLAGVTVRLMRDGAVAYETVTNENGYYLFDDVYPGAYTLTAVAYPQLTITKSVPELRMISSCLVTGDGSSASSEPFEVVSGSNNKDFDLGYILLDGQQPPELPKPVTRDWTEAGRSEMKK